MYIWRPFPGEHVEYMMLILPQYYETDIIDGWMYKVSTSLFSTELR